MKEAAKTKVKASTEGPDFIIRMPSKRWEVVLVCLSKQPYDIVAPVIDDIQNQITAQQEQQKLEIKSPAVIKQNGKSVEPPQIEVS